ncbi:hypothetical protein VP01_1327g3 [Puccinia sorghi]|uniref:Uncharacterized protein n=1 Tax=Puccinia sorghi TaxID=27349 RepID=A0A0L6VMJ1_9BASI|nr:hypothetical protein VP01_1327g3 [Puccinia sorghi]
MVLKDSSPIRTTPEVKEKILAMNPTQREIKLDAITQIIEGYGKVANIQLPRFIHQGPCSEGVEH